MDPISAPADSRAVALARRVLRIEAAAVAALADRVGEEFERAVDIILKRHGRVIVTGCMGKEAEVIRARAAGFAARTEKPIRLLSVLVLALLVVAAVAQEWKTLTTYFAIVGLACLLFNLASMGAGYAAPLALRLPKKQAIAIAMEIGIHNGTLAIFIALNVLQNATISVPAAVYSLLMFVTAAVFAWWVSRGGREAAG